MLLHQHAVIIVSEAANEKQEKKKKAGGSGQCPVKVGMPTPPQSLWLNKGEIRGTNRQLIRKWEDMRRIKKSAIIWAHKLLAGWLFNRR